MTNAASWAVKGGQLHVLLVRGSFLAGRRWHFCGISRVQSLKNSPTLHGVTLEGCPDIVLI